MSILLQKTKEIRKPIHFVGSPVRTTNEAESNGQGIIPAQWQKLYQDGLLDNITSRVSNKIFAIYTDYESDEKGFYTFALASEVEELTDIPLGLQPFSAPEGSYMIFTSRRGPVQEVVFETWQHIWEWSKTNERAFKLDFELYDERSADPQNSQVDIYISIK